MTGDAVFISFVPVIKGNRSCQLIGVRISLIKFQVTKRCLVLFMFINIVVRQWRHAYGRLFVACMYLIPRPITF